MIEFLKIRNVKDPKRNPEEDAGIDFYVPSYSKQYKSDLRKENKNIFISEDCFEVPPHGSVVIPLGIKSKFDKNLSLIAKNKSGVCINTQLIVGACVIDSSYQGEWKLHLINTTNEYEYIEYDSKIIQFLPFYINTEKHKVYDNMSENEFYTEKTNRGEGGFGSTGLK